MTSPFQMFKAAFNLDDHEVIPAMASLVRDHDHFRQLLAVKGGQDRHDMYTAMTPHLRFKAHPLDWYISEAGRRAEAQQLPTYNPETKEEVSFKVPNIGAPPDQDHEAITKIVHESLVSHRLTLTCRRCTFEESFPAAKERKHDAIEAAREKGWVYDPAEKFEMCPKCSELYSA